MLTKIFIINVNKLQNINIFLIQHKHCQKNDFWDFAKFIDTFRNWYNADMRHRSYRPRNTKHWLRIIYYRRVKTRGSCYGWRLADAPLPKPHRCSPAASRNTSQCRRPDPYCWQNLSVADQQRRQHLSQPHHTSHCRYQTRSDLPPQPHTAAVPAHSSRCLMTNHLKSIWIHKQLEVS